MENNHRRKQEYPILILSIPFIDTEFVKKHYHKSNWKEFRLDYSRDFRAFPQECIDPKTIITIRDISEGGINRIEFDEKFSYYKKMIAEYNCLVDCEILLYKKNVLPSKNLILSYHNNAENIDEKKILNIIKISNSIPSRFLKIALNISEYSDIVCISKLIKESTKPVLFAGMGKLGKITRIIHGHLGAEGTYIGMNKYQTAKDQLTEKEMNKFYLSKITRKTYIGGIIGGEQVVDSLGLTYYNRYFHSHNIDAVYLPFVVNDLDDFLNFLKNCNFKDKFYRFSITMPFKKEAGKFNKETEKLQIINLYLPKTKEVYNTDFTAFRKSIEYTGITKKDTFLIFGSGANAETALISLSKFPNVYIMSRNSISGKKLSLKYSRKFISMEISEKVKYDIIINCTPLGMRDENFLKTTNLRISRKVIDLTYTKKNTSLLNECEAKDVLFVDGKRFWHWQAKEQLSKFINEIEYKKR